MSRYTSLGNVAHGAAEYGDAILQHRIGQDARVAHLEEHGRVAQKGRIGLDHGRLGISVSSSGSMTAFSGVADFIHARSWL